MAGGAKKITHEVILTITEAQKRRFRVSLGFGSDSSSAKAPLPFLKILNCRQEVLFPEIRPQLFRHVNLRVGKLPQKKITDAHLTARTNQKIRVRRACRV